MKTITKLKGVVVESEFVEPRGILQAVHHGEPPSAVFMLGSAGLQIKTRTEDGMKTVALPIHELLELAAKHEPAFDRFKK